MAFIASTHYSCGTAKHGIDFIPMSPQLDMSVNPQKILQGVAGNTILNAVVLIADTAFTDGTDAITYTLEIHTQSIQNPVTTATRLVTNMALAPVTAGAADAYTYFNLGRQMMMPLRMIVKKSAQSGSIADDARLGEEKYDVVIRSNAKTTQAGALGIITLSFQASGPDMVPGSTGSCCITGFTPSSN